MPRSLYRTWAALSVAVLGVLLVLGVVGRDFVRDVAPECGGSLVERPLIDGAGELELVPLRSDEPAGASSPLAFHLRYDERTAPIAYGALARYSNVRVVANVLGGDGRPCTLGSIAVALGRDDSPSDLRLYRVHRVYQEPGVDLYVVKSAKPSAYEIRDELAVFAIERAAARHLQTDRILTMRHLPMLVALLALGSLGVALLRSRRAVTYALRVHVWSEARLTSGGLLEDDGGGTLGALEQSRAGHVAPGPVLVAREALCKVGLYRDMPIVQRRHIVEGTHARWVSGTMRSLRDARTLAVVSAVCAALAFGAKLIA